MQFAVENSGAFPALDYLADDRVTQKVIERLAGVITMVRTEGWQRLKQGDQIKTFVGDDATKGMGELRFTANMGHRLLFFRRDGKVLLITNGFQKPAQPHTPPAEKRRAYDILAEHEARDDQASSGGNSGQRSTPQRRRKRRR